MISTFGSDSSSRSSSAGVGKGGLVSELFRQFDSCGLDGGRKRFEVLLEDGLRLLAGEPARNNAKFAQTIGDFRRLGERSDLVPDRRQDRLGRPNRRQKPVP